ncbi:hypothetical protein BLNAU_16464 [Blattamonas nauphoetae]|uniref:Secreted protein n=1 Tax=Blattamonas nauphoetae TaxID=2049346 RepID=A0ABQ9XE98_9EUKA|nr:hypothetical protein BLNAU_16464 [Blattamonas nauphoetae]
MLEGGCVLLLCLPQLNCEAIQRCSATTEEETTASTPKWHQLQHHLSSRRTPSKLDRTVRVASHPKKRAAHHFQFRRRVQASNAVSSTQRERREFHILQLR